MSMAVNLDSIDEEQEIKRQKANARKTKSNNPLARFHPLSFSEDRKNENKKSSTSISYSRSRMKLFPPE